MDLGSSQRVARVLCIVGARPNFMKMAPVLRQLRAVPGFACHLAHTGQHYDPAMNDVFFKELDLPPPDDFLGVGSGSHAEQTAAVMCAIEAVVDRVRPDLVLVVGDVNSTLAAGLVAAKKSIPVAHVEAGLRSFDRTMPEEINRVLTDQISDFLFVTEPDGLANLAREGIGEDKVYLVGNVMIDTLFHAMQRAQTADEVLREAGASATFREGCAAGYAMATMHRASNVDHADVLHRLLHTLRTLADQLNIVLPLHPRTGKAVQGFGLMGMLDHPRLLVLPPLPYLANVSLMREARLVLTDSGGIQEETTALGVPCLTMRENTERPITVSEGTNLLVGTERDIILAAAEDTLRTGGKRGRVPALWDGRTAERISGHLASRLLLSPAVN